MAAPGAYFVLLLLRSVRYWVYSHACRIVPAAGGNNIAGCEIVSFEMKTVKLSSSQGTSLRLQTPTHHEPLVAKAYHACVMQQGDRAAMMVLNLAHSSVRFLSGFNIRRQSVGSHGSVDEPTEMLFVGGAQVGKCRMVQAGGRRRSQACPSTSTCQQPCWQHLTLNG